MHAKYLVRGDRAGAFEDLAAGVRPAVLGHVGALHLGEDRLQIEAENVPLGTTVDVRVVSASGPTNTFTSTPLAGTFESSSATVDVSFTVGYSAVQLRAEFDTGGKSYYGMRETLSLPKTPSALMGKDLRVWSTSG